MVRGIRPQRPVRAVWAGRLLALGAAVLMVMGVLAVFWRPAPPPEAIRFVAQLEGEVVIERAGIRQADDARTWLLPDDVVIAVQSARLVFPDGGSVVLDAETRLQMVRDAQNQTGILLGLLSGRISCDLPRQSAALVIQSSRVGITVLGGQFSLATSTSRDRIAVHEGWVTVVGGEENAILMAGNVADVTATHMIRATTDNPAHLNDSARWRGAGALDAEARVGGALFASEKGAVETNAWSGRGWRWHQALPAASAVAIQARFDVPDPANGITCCEVSWSPPDAVIDLTNAQCVPSLRFGIRSGIASIERLTETDLVVLWKGESFLAGPCLLRLELFDGEVRAYLDGVEMWRGPLGYAEAVPGLRMSRGDSGMHQTLLERVSLDSLLP